MTTRSLVLSAATAVALVLSGCSGTPDVTEPEPVAVPSPTESVTTTGDDEQDDTTTSEQTTATEQTTTTPPAGTSTSTTAPRDPQAVNQGALAAIQRAAESAEGVAFQIDDQDDGSWDVDVAVGNREVEVTVSPDGSQVTGTLDRGQLDRDDAAGVAAATISMRQAVETALGQHDGFLEEVELDQEGAMHLWVVHIDRQGDDVDVHVDVTNGSVVRTDT